MKALFVIVATLFASVGVGCGGPDYGEAFIASYRAAQRAQSAGRYEEAADLYLQAARDAQRVKDRDEAHFNRALMFERLERWDQARSAYRELIAVSPRGPRTGRAAFEHATSNIDHGNATIGWVELVAAIERYPAHGSAPYAIRRWVMHTAETNSEQAVRLQLETWLRKLGGTVLEQQLKYEIGWSLERGGALEEAHAWLLRSAREHPYPKGNLTDDALWRAAQVAQKLGDHNLALRDLEELLAVREDSAVTFSYERPRFPQAQMRVAEIYRDERKDSARARAEFKRMFERHTTSILADDAMWQAALLARSDGDMDDACSLARALPKRFPDSRYVKCVNALCDRAPKGTRPCPPYILEQLR